MSIWFANSVSSASYRANGVRAFSTRQACLSSPSGCGKPPKTGSPNVFWHRPEPIREQFQAKGIYANDSDDTARGISSPVAVDITPCVTRPAASVRRGLGLGAALLSILLLAAESGDPPAAIPEPILHARPALTRVEVAAGEEQRLSIAVTSPVDARLIAITTDCRCV